MPYKCNLCGHIETTWNSRDGVVPFSLDCPSCGRYSTLHHVSWDRDAYAPNHKPHTGQLVFRDGTPDDAFILIRRWAGDEKGDITLGSEKYNEYFPPGWPMYHRHPNERNNAHIIEDLLIDIANAVGNGEVVLQTGDVALTEFGEHIVDQYTKTD